MTPPSPRGPRRRVAHPLTSVVTAVAAAFTLVVASVDAIGTTPARPGGAAMPPPPPPAAAAAEATTAAPVAPAAPAGVPGMPPVLDPQNLYSETAAGKVLPALKDDLPRIYVPNLRGHNVTVIDPATLKVVDRFKVGFGPQHVVPSWDLRTLWVANNAERRTDGSLTPVDPRTGKPGKSIPVDDPYNLYFSPDGKSAIVVAEARKRLDFRDPQTMAMQYAIHTPKCAGINHADFSPDGRTAIFTCEFDGTIAKIDLVERKVLGYLKLKMPAQRFKGSVPAGVPPELEVCTVTKGMPQDVRISPDGKTYYVADMAADGLHVIDAASFTEVDFVRAGVAPHGLYPSRDGKLLYIANRGSHDVHGKRRGPGSVSVMDFATRRIVATWPIPKGGSPDMGNLTADGRYLWLSGRFDDAVYRIDTTSGKVDEIANVGMEPHGLVVWPQPGRYSLGHTGNLR